MLQAPDRFTPRVLEQAGKSTLWALVKVSALPLLSKTARTLRQVIDIQMPGTAAGRR